MGSLFQLAMFSPDGKGRLSRIEEMIDLHSRFIESMEAEDGATLRRNAKGGVTISATSRRGTQNGYRSFFKVIDASAGGSCTIGVTNGSTAMLSPVGLCGRTKVNAVSCDVAAITHAVSAAGVYHVWIHSWLAYDGVHCSIVVGAIDNDEPPDNPFGGIFFASQLAGTVTVEAVTGGFAIADIVQHYLRGGEHAEWLFGDCLGKTLNVDSGT